MQGLRKSLLTGRGRWITYCVAAVLLIILVNQLAPYLSSPKRTGDPLFDRMQREISLSMHRGPGDMPNFYGGYFWRNAPALRAVESWEADFAERSDYWFLRALCERAKSGGDFNQALLEKADACSDARPAVSALLMHNTLREIRLNDA